jgi:hypothetical protein
MSVVKSHAAEWKSEDIVYCRARVSCILGEDEPVLYQLEYVCCDHCQEFTGL